MNTSEKLIPYGRQHVTTQDLTSVEAALRSDALTSGPLVTQFEAALCKVSGAKHAIACANATAGLHLACLALRLPASYLGVTAAITFAASSNCFEFTGGRSDFIDIDPSSRCISIDALSNYCETVEIPAVVVAVSFGGVTADLPALKQLSLKYGFKLIEDAAHSIGSNYEYLGQSFNSGSCTHSDLAVFSFHPVKTITTGEGGAVLTNDDALAERVRLLRGHGIARGEDHIPAGEGAWYYEMMELGYNYRITDIQCALGISQLSRIEDTKQRRLEIVQQYIEGFAEVDGLQTAQWPAQDAPCFHLAIAELPFDAEFRRKVYNGLRERNIVTQIHYIPVYWHPYYRNKYNYRKGKCPAAEHYYSHCLSLPLYIGLTDAEVTNVIEALKEEITKHTPTERSRDFNFSQCVIKTSV